MLKFAFLVHMPGESPETYGAEYENGACRIRVAGVEKSAAAGYARKLAEEGFSVIDLCGDFTEEEARDMGGSLPEGTSVRPARYGKEQEAKLDALPDMKEYGILIHGEGLSEPVDLSIEHPECNTRIAVVSGLEAAEAAAGRMAAGGIRFIELCSWFDREKTASVIRAAGGAVPVGSCGEPA